MMPIIAGTPLSSANHTCASCVSLGAKDIAIISLFSSINCSPYAPISQRNKSTNIVNIRVGPARKHSASSRKPEPVPLDLNPVLNSLLNTQLLVRYIRVPRVIPALWPFKGALIVRWGRDKTPQQLVFRRAVPFPVLEHVPVELPASLLVFARSVLGRNFSVESEELTASWWWVSKSSWSGIIDEVADEEDCGRWVLMFSFSFSQLTFEEEKSVWVDWMGDRPCQAPKM
ncbi:sodium channel protein [Striga asiatica]|uniref:Sodium channel protein n=1 Tax=Striga asiatica TaxID=4170 RepID=A0A5A7PRP2_STRAF|nr:sodium channel protein [Striga asiatica]